MALDQSLVWISQVFLTINHSWFIGLACIFGLCSPLRHAFIRALLICGWVMVWNLYLKHIFHVPLLPHLGPGWAFPSGHMHAGCMFWVWLAWDLNKRWLWLAISLMIPLAGVSIVIASYHTVYDIMGAYLFSGIELACLALMAHRMPRLKNPIPWSIMIGSLILITLWLDRADLSVIHGAVVGAFIGVILIWMTLLRRQMHTSRTC